MKPKAKAPLLACRILLLLLILANMTLIFLLSHQDGKESGETSKRVTEAVAQTTVKDFDQKPDAEQDQIIDKLNIPVRTLAHMGEFGLLSALSLLFLLTWKKKIPFKYAGAVAFSALYACTDEWHQSLVGGRASEWKDVAFDTLGAVIGAGFALLFYWIIIHARRKRNTLKTTRYFLQTNQKDLRLRIALASDLHGTGHEKVLRILEREHPDLILIPGDLMEDNQLGDPKDEGFAFLRAAAAIAPTYYSFGNHETGCYHKGKPWSKPEKKPLPPHAKEYIAATGVILLDDEQISQGKLTICGLTSGLNGKVNRPDLSVIEKLDVSEGFRILLCHHPEYFMPYIQKTGIELTVSGHAHGGQWRLFGRGAFAPGQGILPKYTSGVLENRCVISRGIGNHTIYPRIFNAPEVVMIYYGYTREEIGT